MVDGDAELQAALTILLRRDGDFHHHRHFPSADSLCYLQRSCVVRWLCTSVSKPNT